MSLQDTKQSPTLLKLIDKNQKNIFTVVLILVVGLVAYTGYRKLYFPDLEREAIEESFFAKEYFYQDSLELALHGDGQNYGFMDIIDHYGATPTGNLARYFVGVSYYKQSNYAGTLEMLADFQPEDILLKTNRFGIMGDACAQMGNYQKAQEYYEKAAAVKSTLLAPVYLKKAGIVSLQLKDFDKALSFFSKIATDFPEDPLSQEVKPYIAKTKSLQQ